MSLDNTDINEEINKYLDIYEILLLRKSYKTTIVWEIIYMQLQLCHFFGKCTTTTYFPLATPSTPESGVQCSEVLVQVIPEKTALI